MKTIPSSIQTILDAKVCIEPYCTVEIEWTDGSVTAYSDKDKVLSISTISNVESTSTVTVVIDDTDGAIKSRFGQIDIQKRPCVIKQHFVGSTDSVTLVRGRIESNIVWSEIERTVKFDVISEIEQDYFGINTDNTAWPTVFGTARNVPAPRVTHASEATLDDEICVVDPVLRDKIQQLLHAHAESRAAVRFWAITLQKIETEELNAGLLLDALMALLFERNRLLLAFEAKREEIDAQREFVFNFIDDDDEWRRLSELVEEFNRITDGLDFIATAEPQMFVEVSKLLYFKELKSRLVQQINSFNQRTYQLHVKYRELASELCRQEKCQKLSVNVSSSTFTEGQAVDVVLENVRFRVMFTDTKMDILAGPLPLYQNVAVATWSPDDDTCHHSIDMFRLQDVVDLRGQYLLVRRRDNVEGARHILQVTHQENDKVYFRLVPWDKNTSGSNRSTSLETYINRTASMPLLDLPFYGRIPEDYFTGELDPDLWNTTEAAEFLTLVGALNFYTEDEKRAIAALVYLKPYDALLPPVLPTPSDRTTYTIIGEDVVEILETSGTVLEHWLDDWNIPHEEVPENQFFSANAGSRVSLADERCAFFAVNTMATTIHSVKAEYEGVLTTVPPEFYSEVAGPEGSVLVKFNVPLAGDWGSNIYVTQTSSVGPNAADVIEWLIGSANVNAASFAAANTKLTNYPVGYAVFGRNDRLAEAKRVAYESRCALVQRATGYHLVYLAEQPALTAITNSEIDAESYTIQETDTSNLGTRMVATWRPDYYTPERVLTAELNTDKYGVLEVTESFHCFNHESLVKKSASFWLVRRANSWKHIQFEGTYNFLAFDVWDGVTYDGYNAVITNIQLDTDTHTIAVTAQTSTRTGTASEYQFYWPAALLAGTVFTEGANEVDLSSLKC